MGQISVGSNTGGTTLAKLNDLLEKYVWNVHSRTTTDRLRLKYADPEMTPAKAWDRLVKDFPPTVPVPLEEYRKTTFAFLRVGKLDHAGVRADHLEYRSEALAALYRRRGPIEVEIHAALFDAGRVRVLDRETGEAVEALATQQVAHGITRSVWGQLVRRLNLGRDQADAGRIADELANLLKDAADAASKQRKSQKRAAAKAGASQSMAADVNGADTSATGTGSPNSVEPSAPPADERPPPVKPRQTTVSFLGDPDDGNATQRPA